MNILFLSHRVPYPPNRGDKIRSFHIVRHLSKRHSVSVACLAQSKEELKHAEALKEHCDSVYVSLLKPAWSKMKSLLSIPRREPLSLSYFHSRHLQKVVDKLLTEKSFDLVFVYSSSMAQYVVRYRDKFSGRGVSSPSDPQPEPGMILDFVDVDSAKWLQYAEHTGFPMSAIYRLEGRRLRRFEASIASQFDHCLVVSEPEKDLLESYTPEASISAISNGVDFDYFRPQSDEYEPHSLIFTGVMDYHANVDGVTYFCKRILPLIKSEIPQIRFYIVGSSPVKEVQGLAQEDDIIVTGFVEDIRPYLDRAAVCVVPLRIARGIQNKILEAMAMEIPVVTTPIAFEGIDAKPGRHLFVESDPQGFAARVIELLRNSELRTELAQSGRKLILERYNWDTNMARLDKIIQEMFAG